MTFDIIIAGVGGQGTVLASRMLAQAAVDSGLFARTAENIGMAQREGSVQSHVRIGRRDFGPLIPEGGADLMIAFEPAEAVRSLPLLKKGGTALVNRVPIEPVTVALGRSSYDKEGIIAYLKNKTPNLRLFSASGLADEAGNLKTANVVMLGAAAGLEVLPFSADVLLKTLLKSLPERLREVNEKAFELGKRAVC